MSEEKQEKKSEDKSKVEDEKIMAALSYIWILFLVPLILKKDNKFCMFHVKQGIILFIFEIIVYALGMIPVLGWFIFAPLGTIIALILAVLGVVNALQGREWKMPYLHRFVEKLNF